MYRQRKRRKTDEPSFRGLIDPEQPLWRDIFSIIFSFQTDTDLNRVLRSSNVMYSLVRERAVFNGILDASRVNPCLRILKEFFFSKIVVREAAVISQVGVCKNSEDHPLLRQRFLKKVWLRIMFDLRQFLSVNNSGNRIFRYLDHICLHTGFTGSYQECHIFEFLHGYRKRIDLYLGSNNKNFFGSGEELEKFVEVGQFNTIYFGPHIFGNLAEKDFCHIKSLDAKSFTFTPFDRFVNGNFILQNLSLNENIEELRFFSVDELYYDVERVNVRGGGVNRKTTIAPLKMLMSDQNAFPSLKRLEIDTIDSPGYCHQQFMDHSFYGDIQKLWNKRKGMEKLILRWSNENPDNYVEGYDYLHGLCTQILRLWKEAGIRVEVLGLENIKKVDRPVTLFGFVSSRDQREYRNKMKVELQSFKEVLSQQSFDEIKRLVGVKDSK